MFSKVQIILCTQIFDKSHEDTGKLHRVQSEINSLNSRNIMSPDDTAGIISCKVCSRNVN